MLKPQEKIVAKPGMWFVLLLHHCVHIICETECNLYVQTVCCLMSVDRLIHFSGKLLVTIAKIVASVSGEKYISIKLCILGESPYNLYQAST